MDDRLTTQSVFRGRLPKVHMPRGSGTSGQQKECTRRFVSAGGRNALVLERKAHEMVFGTLPAMLSSSYRLLLRLNSRVDPPQEDALLFV